MGKDITRVKYEPSQEAKKLRDLLNNKFSKGSHKNFGGYEFFDQHSDEEMIGEQDGGYQRVVWKTDRKYWWSNGFAKDEFKVVNPYTYSSNGRVNTMFGPLPEMKGKTVAITASYGRHKDKIYIKLR